MDTLTMTAVEDNPVTTDQIAAVIARPDRIERNHGVTETYSRLANALVQRLGRNDLTWCAFATWASNSAGAMIAMQEVPAMFRGLIAESGQYQQHLPHVRHVLDEIAVVKAGEVVAHQISDALSDGNTLVFAELAPAFVALLNDEPLPDDTSGPDGTNPLTEPFERYRRALVDSDPARSAQDILAGNVLAVYHEQQRLQPYIVAALDASILDVFHELTGHVLSGRLAKDLEPHLTPVLHAIDNAWDEALTHYATTLTTPTEVLHLGRDVPPLADGTLYPEVLVELVDPDPMDVIRRFDRSDSTLIGSAAADWARLEDRMNYIVNLFRSRQQDATLLQLPVLTTDPPGGRAART